jgi:hypothetical protein
LKIPRGLLQMLRACGMLPGEVARDAGADLAAARRSALANVRRVHPPHAHLP